MDSAQTQQRLVSMDGGSSTGSVNTSSWLSGGGISGHGTLVQDAGNIAKSPSVKLYRELICVNRLWAFRAFYRMPGTQLLGRFPRPHLQGCRRDFMPEHESARDVGDRIGGIPVTGQPANEADALRHPEIGDSHRSLRNR